MKMTHRLLIVTTLAALAIGCGGSKYDVDTWRQYSGPSGDATVATDHAATFAKIESLRDEGDLATARDLALSAAKEWPDDAGALWRAARAESDAVFLHLPFEKDQRAMAALSSLDWSRRAIALAPDDPRAASEFAWSLGTTTHLQPMMKRSAHARETRQAIDHALELDPESARAYATDALLQFRLQTLPTMAKVMAVSRPDSSLEAAESAARHAYNIVPSIEFAVILAKIEKQRGETAEAINLLEGALAQPDQFPRDAEHRDAAREVLLQLHEQEGKG